MSDIAEGIGTAIEGSLVGKAVEPDGSGEGPAGERGDTCLNCGADLNGAAYCHNCGQKSHVHRSLTAIFHDLIHGVLHLDGKFWLTLPLLVFRPGKLTRRYIEGERAKFVSPMAMFLFSVFAMFAVFQMVGLTAPTDLAGDARAQVTQMLEAERASINGEIARIDEELAAPELDDTTRASLEIERERLETDLGLLDTRGQNITNLLTSGSADFVDNLQSAGENELASANERLATLPEGSQEYRDLASEIATAEQGIEDLEQFEAVLPITTTAEGSVTLKQTGVGFIDSFLEKWTSNPSLMLYKLQANGYKFSWLLIPLSIPFVWLIFAWKRRFKAYDHAIFVTYSLSFMSLLFITMSLIAASPIDAGGGWAFAIFTVAAPLHVYKHLKYTYDLSRFSAIWRFFALLIFILMVLALFLQALLVLGAF
ncbi:MAG: DUF3667 domain-containing protein [Pseudomonadota bacterium]